MKNLISLTLLLLTSFIAKANHATLIQGTKNSNPAGITAYYGTFLFRADYQQNQHVLWQYREDSGAAPLLVRDRFPVDVRADYPGVLAVVNKEIFYRSSISPAPSTYLPALFSLLPGQEPKLLNFNTFYGNNPTNMMAHQNKLYAVMDTSGLYRRLWAYDPATQVGRRVNDVYSDYVDYSGLTVMNDKIYFASSTNGYYPLAIREYDPATDQARTVPIEDTTLIPVGPFTVADNKLYLIMGVKKSPKEYKLCVYDGINPIKALVPLFSEDAPWGGHTGTDIVEFQNKIYFRGTVNNLRTWSYDPATGQASEVAALNSYDVTDCKFMFVYHGKLYFSAPTTFGHIGLYNFDGTHPPALVDSNASSPQEAFIFNDKLYFTAFAPGDEKRSLYTYYEPDSSAPSNYTTNAIAYPNPATTEANFSFILNKEEPLAFIITDASGRTAFRKPLALYPAGKNIITFGTASFFPGYYYCRVVNEQNKPVAGAKLLIR